ncbi:hypothetical protein FB45DRAFT_890448, partial [Roridomyces roridus]
MGYLGHQQARSPPSEFGTLIPLGASIAISMLLAISAVFRTAGMCKSKVPWWRQRYSLLEGCPPVYPRYTPLAVLLGRSVARPLVRGESFLIIVVRALILACVMLGLPAIAVYYVVIVPKQTVIYTQLVGSDVSYASFPPGVPQIYLYSNGQPVTDDVLNGVNMNVTQCTWETVNSTQNGVSITQNGVSITIETSTQNDVPIKTEKCVLTSQTCPVVLPAPFHHECPLTWDQIVTLSISFPSSFGLLDMYIQAGTDFELGRGESFRGQTAFQLTDPIPLLPQSYRVQICLVIFPGQKGR